MDSRFWIRVGDTTSNGGRVITGSATHLHHSLPLAFEGDQVDCPGCRSIGTIACVGDRISDTGPDGRQKALSGDLCLCRCNPPPVLVALQQTASTQGHTQARFDEQGSGFAGLPPHDPTHSHDQRFLVLTHDQQPVADRLYRLTYPGGIAQGRTDAQGYTEPVSGIGEADVRIEVFGEGH